MNRPLLLVVLISLALPVHGATEETAEPTIVAGEGWGVVKVGATKEQIVAALGTGKVLARYDDVCFVEYLEKGIQVSFLTRGDTVNAIFFYNKQKGDNRFATFQGKTSKGIDWSSSAKRVIEVYGKPIRDYSGADGDDTWRRLVFKGIDFRFENEKMVRISVPAGKSRRVPGQY